MDAPGNRLYFSAASLREIVFKRGLGREDFQVDPHALRRGLTDNGYHEMPINGAHALMVDNLPALHTDPFDRILIAQAMVEGLMLMTSDGLVARYPGSIHKL
jgi:PIN domain nuclease of toxin-antitoxin system